MLSLLKRKSDAAAAPLVPAWHPNFRNYEKLPDIKVVRTAFFVNGLAVCVALGLAVYLGFHEWQLRVINGQVRQVEAQIARDKKVSDQVVATFKKFQAEEARIKEVDAFVGSRPVPSRIIFRLGEILPENIAVDSIDLRDAGMSLRLSVRGATETAAAHATAFQEQLKSDQQLATLFDEVVFTASTPNPATGHLAVEFVLRLKGGPKK